MAPLTSPSSCVSCSRFAEMLMDTITFGPTQSASLCASGSDAAPSGPDAAPETAEAAPPLVPAAAAADPPPDTVSDDSWIRHGARPRVLTSSTPSDPEPWCLVPALGRRGRRSSHAPHHNIQLENKFEPLAFPPVDEEPDRPPPPSSSPSQGSHGSPSPPRPSIAIHERSSLRKTLRSIPLFTPAPQRAPAPLYVGPCPATSSLLVKSPPPTASPTSSSHETPHSASPRPLFPPTTLITGDSITRHIRFFNAVTHCFPGATVPVILQKLPDLLNTLPSSIHRIIVHVGINDSSL
ncbi:uncharacterized protein LOC126383485 isoform X2 [Epinephelus moara]|uniref:uncharacterized protein LOC126383485 isoform X2 n=1 Tax=Epinephelus moara TaxID=300413 RepID=UPI00214EBFC9|nr:uncharacterized protein LOC126383485 isoform X2 [Epinephelus moara]